MKRVKTYEEYRKNFSKYQAKRRKLLKKPEENLHQLAKDFKIYELRSTVEYDVNALIKEGWELYSEIYNGEPSLKNIDKFLDIANSVIVYEDFITLEQINIWKITSNLISAYRERFINE